MSNTKPTPIRMTRQRRAVLADLAENPTFRSAQQIYDSLETSGDPISLATVYRNLQILATTDNVDVLSGEGGELFYRLCETDTHHHHLICQSCGAAEEVQTSALEQTIRRLASERGYQLGSHHLELYGLCPACRSRSV